MSGSPHDTFARENVTLPPERSTGLVFTAAALVVAWFWRDSIAVLWTALAAALILAVISFLKPALLRPLNIVWFRFGLLLHRVVNPVVMFVIFTVVFIPAGFLMRIWHDPLRRRRNPQSKSYWIERAEEKRAGSMANQF